MGWLTGQQVDPGKPTNLTEQLTPGSTADKFFQALFGTGLDTTTNPAYGMFKGLPGYQGLLSPGEKDTRMPDVSSAWQPWNAGTGFLADYISKPNINPAFPRAQSNIEQFGGIGGYPTQLLHDQAQFGGTGGPGHLAMSSLMQFGVPSAAGQPIAQMAQQGGSGQWGAGLQQLANGTSPAAQYLLPFLLARPYNSAGGG